MGITYPRPGNPSVSISGAGTDDRSPRAAYGTAAEWVAANPVLALGEVGYETDTYIHKIGDGSTAWTSLTASNSGTYAQLGAPSFGPLGMILDGASSNVGIQVLGDSTGNDTDEWPYLLAQYIATTWPTLGVRHRLWSDGSQDYAAPTVIQSPAAERKVAFGGGVGSFVYYATSSAYNITTDLDVQARVALTDWTPSAAQAICARFGSAGNRGWRFWVGTDGKLNYQSSNDGTALPVTVASSVAPTVSDAAALWVRMVHDVDNGAAGNDVKFYTSTDGTTWTQLGTTVTTGGTTTINNPTWPLEAATRSTGSDNLIGSIYELRIRDGIGGPLIAPAAIEAWPRSSGTITVSGNPWVDVINASFSGAGITYLFDTTRLPKLTPDYGTAAVIFSISHNDATLRGPIYTTSWDTALTTIRTRLPTAQPVVTMQNPRFSPATYISEHVTRMSNLRAWARKNGAGVLDVWRAFASLSDGGASLINTDGIHPIGAGKTLWLSTVEAALTARY